MSIIPNFVPRLTRPLAGNKYYITKASGGYSDAIKGKPTDSQCDVLHNCVGYAYGRFNEIIGEGGCFHLRPVNAEDFMKYKGTCKTGMTPKLGAVMVWQKGKGGTSADGAGHVAIVEQIISSTEVVSSESGYNASKPFWTQTRKKGNGNWGADSSYTFLGFIYNPAVKDEGVSNKDNAGIPSKSDENKAGDSSNTGKKSADTSCGSGKETVYTVVKGDTLSAIAKHYGTTYQVLAKYNSISDPNIISVGQKIKIPAGGETRTYRTYTVKRGDTLWGIAKSQLGNGTRYTEIKTLNGLSNDAIYAGQTLRLPE